MIFLAAPEGFDPHWRDDLDNEAYHADRDFVSSSQLKYLLAESPAYFHDAIFSPVVKKTTDAMLLSSLVHHAVLEGEDFIRRYVVQPDFTDLHGLVLHKNSNLYKDKLKAWKLETRGKVVVTQQQLQVLEGTYESIFNHADAAGILRGSLFERSGFYVDPATHVRCRIRYDSYDQGSRLLADLKAVRSCKKGKFSLAIRDYRWDLSMAMYAAGIEAIDGAPPDEQVFIAVEKTRPYHCAVYPLGAKSRAIGRSDYQKALAMLKSCATDNSWPPYQEQHEEIELPESFMRKYL